MTRFLGLVIVFFSISTFAEDESWERKSKDVRTAWDFTSYLKEFVDEDESYQKASYDLRIANAQYRVASDLFQSTLTLQPTYLTTKTLYSDGLTPNVEQNRKSLVAGLRQSLSLGTQFSFDGTFFLDNVDPHLGGINRQYNASIEQPIWRNAFGLGGRSRRNSADLNQEGASHARDKALLASCISAAETYLSAFLVQEKLKIREEAFKDSQKALDIARRGFDRRLLRKIDFLAAKADFLQVQANKINAKTERDKSLNTLYVRVARWQGFEEAVLTEPAAFFMGLMTPTDFSKEEMPAYQETMAKVTSGRYTYQAAKSENRSLVNLGISGGRSTRVGATPSTPAFSATNNDFVQLYLKLELPIVNRTQNGNISSSYYQLQKAEADLRRMEKDLQSQFVELQLQRKKLEEQLKLSTENQQLKKQQFQEAQRLLNVGKIEFVDYIRYRDTYFSERENNLDIKSNLWQSRAKLAQYGSDMGKSCQEAI